MTALVMLAVGEFRVLYWCPPNASLHKWQQAVAPGWLPYMVPQNWIQARTESMNHKLIKIAKAKPD